MPSWASSGSLSITPPVMTSLPRTSPSVCLPAQGGRDRAGLEKRKLGHHRQETVSVRTPGGLAGRSVAFCLVICHPPSGDPGLGEQQEAQPPRATVEGPSTPRWKPTEPSALCQGWALGSRLSEGWPRGQRLRPGASDLAGGPQKQLRGERLQRPFLESW